MRTIPKWVNKIHEADKSELSSVQCACFSPDGLQLVVGAGERVMVYDPADGALLRLLQAHRGAVHSLAYCADGKKFASGSADKNVIIWTSKMEGILKYSHGEAIQCIAYNPVTFQLASCAASDFAFWSSEVKAVQKYRVVGRITCCAWAPAGQQLAIGLASGCVSIRDKCGEEVQRWTRDSAVWALAFAGPNLLVTDWNDTLSFYNLQGQQVLKERNIGISAVWVCTMGELIVVAGAGGWAVLTAEGVPVLSAVLDWVWCAVPSPARDSLALACHDGTLWCYQLVFSTVHGLYRDRYAYRENITDVIIQHLSTGNKVRIKCHDRVHKIAIYKRRLAVQLPERIVVYEVGDTDPDCMLYRVKEKIQLKQECSLLVATGDALLLCQDTKLVMIGKKLPKTWTVPAPIRYVKVTPLYSEEVLLLGLLNGEVWQVQVKSGSSTVLVRSESSGASAGAVRCLDVSASRARLAVVDEHSVCRVYALPAGDLIYTEENVSAVSWNDWCEELVCLSGGGLLSVKAGNFPPAAQPLTGSVVGFQGGRVFCLQSNAMQTVGVPLSHAMHQYLQHGKFAEAYAVACLSATRADWERLAAAALNHLALDVARNAYQRTEDVPKLALVDDLQERLASGEARSLLNAEVLAHCGRFSEAARAFVAAGRPQRALHMYIDLRMFNKAQEYVDENEAGVLARRRAEWARHVSEPRAAAEMLLAAGDVRGATALLADAGRRDMLLELARDMDKGSTEGLRHVAAALVRVGEGAAAADLYHRLADYNSEAALLVARGEWTRAFALARDHPDCSRSVYLAYAQRMARDNNFVEAQKAFHMAGEEERARRVCSVLISGAVAEERFADAAQLHALAAAQGGGASDDRLARLYHAYDPVHRSVHEPFSLSQPEALLHAAAYALGLMGDDTPPSAVSLFCLYLCLAKQATAMHARVLSNEMLNKILALKVPPKFQESVELLTLKTRAASAGGSSSNGDGDDPDEAGALCWRCRRPAARVPHARCPRCGHEPVRSHASHEVLPLVRFEPAEGISVEEALQLLDRAPLPEATSLKQLPSMPHTHDILTLVEPPNDNPTASADPFLEPVIEEDEGVVRCGRDALVVLNPAAVVVVRPPPPAAPRFYRNMLPELPCTTCPHCQQLFYAEDYEIYLVTRGHCPFCRQARSADPTG